MPGWTSEDRYRALQQAHDELERRLVERTRQFEAAHDGARRSDRVKTAFLSTVSHELRTPLNAIIGFTDVVLMELSGPLTEQQRQQLAIVRQSASGLRDLIENLLDVSRIEAGQVGLEIEHFDLTALLMQRAGPARADARSKGLDLRVDESGPPVHIRSDRRRVAQIVDHLVSNAIKFTPRGGVSIELDRSQPERVEVAIADTGIGIPDDAFDTLFDPFAHVGRPGGALRQGTGLGLAIARNLARALGGDLTVTSKVGAGSRFTLSLPHEHAANAGAWAQIQAGAIEVSPTTA